MTCPTAVVTRIFDTMLVNTRKDSTTVFAVKDSFFIETAKVYSFDSIKTVVTINDTTWIHDSMAHYFNICDSSTVLDTVFHLGRSVSDSIALHTHVYGYDTCWYINGSYHTTVVLKNTAILGTPIVDTQTSIQYLGSDTLITKNLVTSTTYCQHAIYRTTRYTYVLSCTLDTLENIPHVSDSTTDSTYMSISKVHLSDTLLVYQRKITPAIRVYPNPTLGIVTVELPDHFTATILSIDGRVISETHATDRVEISFADFARGVYFITLRTSDPDFLWNERIIKE